MEMPLNPRGDQESIRATERHRKATEEPTIDEEGECAAGTKKQRTLPEMMHRAPTEADKPSTASEDSREDDSRSSISSCRGDPSMCIRNDCGEETDMCECGQAGRQCCSVHAATCRDRLCAECAERTVTCNQCGAETHENDPEGFATSTVAIKVPGELLEKFPGFPATLTVTLCEECVPFN